jgi:glyceraldehyde 3-phosphate dehydrogenase
VSRSRPYGLTPVQAATTIAWFRAPEDSQDGHQSRDQRVRPHRPQHHARGDGQRDIDFVAVNDLTNAATLAHLLKYDSILGNLEADIAPAATASASTATSSRCSRIKDPAQLPWKDLGVEVVFEGRASSPKPRRRRQASAAGAKKVIITAPAKKPGHHARAGRQRREVRPGQHHIISNASCTTNCLAPIAKVLHERFGIRKGWMTTVHSYTNDQQLLDLPHKDLRRARAAACRSSRPRPARRRPWARCCRS